MAEHGIAITRVFDAPRELIFEVWTDPEHMVQWWGARGFTTTIHEMDVRPGGSWRATMFAGPERREIRWKGEYREVVEPERLVFTISDQPGEDAYELVTVALTDLGGDRTEMHFEQRGRMSPEQYERAGAGWSGFFDRIAERLAAG